jgi:hypothetical protein
MIDIRLIGSPICRRYQMMRTSVIHEAEKLGIRFAINEIGYIESLAQFNPLSLPRLYIQGDLIASKNPPKPQDIALALQKVWNP